MMIIAVDGPAASGKGTLARNLSRYYQLAFLDTGLLYRAVAAKMLSQQTDLTNQHLATQVAINIRYTDLIEEQLRTESISQAASKIAVYQDVRTALLNIQRDFAHNPPAGYFGTVLDGRDIGTRICPDTPYKFYVTADIEVRAQRRCKELQEKMIESIYDDVLQEMIQRDQRDKHRSIWPLRPAEDAIIVDTTNRTAQEALDFAVDCISLKMPVYKC